MNELPTGWVTADVGCLATYVSRGRSPKYVDQSDLPIVNQKCVRWSGVDQRYVKFVDPLTWDAWSDERFLRHGDILWNSTGTGTIGRAALYRGLQSFDRAVVDSHVTIVRTGDAICSDYLFRFIQSPAVQGRIEGMQSGSTNQVELNRSEVVATEVPVPPLSEQHRIVVKLDALTARTARARADLDRIPALAARYRRSVLEAVYEGGLSSSKPTLKLVADVIARLDQGWSPKCGDSPAAQGEWGVIKTTAIQPLAFHGEANKALPNDLLARPHIELRAGDVLITRAGPRTRVGVACAIQ